MSKTISCRDAFVGQNNNWIKFSTHFWQKYCVGVLDTDEFLTLKLFENCSCRLRAKPIKFFENDNYPSYNFLLWKVNKHDFPAFVEQVLEPVRNMAFINGYADYDEAAKSLELLKNEPNSSNPEN